MERELTYSTQENNPKQLGNTRQEKLLILRQPIYEYRLSQEGHMHPP
jgi:hypothetical protein